MLRNILKRRILFAVLMASMLLGVAFLTAFTSPPAEAKGCWWRTTTYYSDATYSTVIGQYIIPCEGQTQIWGSTSGFAKKDTGECGC
ncbi:MAG TPA: DUF6289 family protein [Pyrinomonadaceae bacterium]|nr:DUF6289 family protein [Pyrinomonadaceae bacterium]